MTRKPEAGWRFFECWECGERWKSPCRDHETPSTEACPCGENVSPVSSCADASANERPWGQVFLS
jgi:hypothetical protein